MRYKVLYEQEGSCTEDDYCICYGKNKAEAEEAFHRYHPDDIVRRVERFTGLKEMSQEGDLKEFTDRLIEAICDQDRESIFVDLLYQQRYGRG